MAVGAAVNDTTFAALQGLEYAGSSGRYVFRKPWSLWKAGRN
jgi:hypothetical protein